MRARGAFRNAFWIGVSITMVDFFNLGLRVDKTLGTADGLTFENEVVPQAAIELASGNSALATLTQVLEQIRLAFAGKESKGGVRCVIETTTPVSIGFTYSGGVLTAGSNGSINAFEPQGLTDIAVGDAILVIFTDSAARKRSGPYTVTVVGDGSTAAVLTRATNWDSSDEAVNGSFWVVNDGTAKGAVYAMTTEGAITLDTTAIVIEQILSAGGISSDGLHGFDITSFVGSVKINTAIFEFDGSGNITIKAGGIDTAQLAGQAVDVTILADDAVETAKIKDLNVTAAKLAAAVTVLLPKAAVDSSSTAITSATPTALTFSSAPNIPINTRAWLDVYVDGENDADATKTWFRYARVCVYRGGSGAAVVLGHDYGNAQADAGTGSLAGVTFAVAPNGTGGDLDVVVTSLTGINAHYKARLERR